MGPNSESTSETLRFPKLNDRNYHAWADNMKAALQAQKLWLLVDSLEECPPIPTPKPPFASEDLPYSTSSVEYRDWWKSREDYLDWLVASAAIGLMKGAIKFRQHKHIVNISTSKEMWDPLHNIHITQHQGINIHYYYQELYTKKWDKHTTMSDYIGFFLNLHHHIIEVGQKLEDIHLIHPMLLSLPCLTIWDIVKQNLLDKRKILTLDMVTAELIAVTDWNKWDHQAEETEKKAKAEQLALFVKSGSSGVEGSSEGNKKRLKKSKRKPKPTDEYHRCHQKGHWSNNCPNVSNERKISEESANLTVDSLNLIGNCEVEKVMMAVMDNIETAGILLDCGAT